jgi:hypothetical protein
MTDLILEIPEFNITLTPGCRVKLGRFDIITWILSYGWYSWGGNREVCGWYLTNIKDVSDLKPLYRTDLDDIYLIET